MKSILFRFDKNVKDEERRVNFYWKFMGRVVRNLQGVSIAHAVDAWYNPNCKF